MGFGSFLFGQKGRMEQTPLYNQQQSGAMGSMLGQAMGGLNSGQFDFAPIEQQARQGFQQQTIPGIAERFSMMGSGGGQRSSAFAGSLGQAGANLEGQLAQQKQTYGMQQQNQLMQMLQMALQPQFENNYRPGHGGLFGSMMGGASEGMGKGISSLLPMLFGL